MILLIPTYSLSITTTAILFILLQTLTNTHMSPLSAPTKTSLDLLLDPIFQSEQEEQLETRAGVPRSVYNTVIRVTSTPCLPGTQRVKAGGDCVPRYSSSGPVLDEEYKLSILKGITSLGGITRRPHNNKHNRHRHRTTTMRPATTTIMTTTLEPTEPPTHTPPTSERNQGEYFQEEDTSIEDDRHNHFFFLKDETSSALSLTINKSSFLALVIFVCF